MMKYQNATNKITVCYGKITNLTLRSKFKVKGYQQCYTTHRLEVVYLHAKYEKPILNDKKSYSLDTICYGRTNRFDLEVKVQGQKSVTNIGTRHIVWRWSTYMPNMQSLSWTTKKLQPAHDLLRMHGPVWLWGQSSRSKVTNNSMWHIVWRWSTYMPNMESLSWTTKKLQPGHDLLRTHGPVSPWGQSSRSKITNNGTRHIVWRCSTYMPNMQSLS
jgi:hypothetical protein